MSNFFYAINNGQHRGIYWSRTNFERWCPRFRPEQFNTFADAFDWITDDDNGKIFTKGQIIKNPFKNKDHVPPEHRCRGCYFTSNGTAIVFTDGSAYENGPDCEMVCHMKYKFNNIFFWRLAMAFSGVVPIDTMFALHSSIKEWPAIERNWWRQLWPLNKHMNEVYIFTNDSHSDRDAIRYKTVRDSIERRRL